MSLKPLSQLLVSDRAAETPVSWRGEETLSFGRFRADVAAVAVRFADTPAAAIACRDSYRFAVGLFGLLSAGAHVVLPPSDRPAALAPLRGAFSALVDDAAVAAAGAADGTPIPVDAEKPAIDFFTSGSTGAPKRIVKTLAMFEREAAMLEAAFGAGLDGTRVFATVPHQHMYGLPFKLLWPLSAGRPFCAATHDFWEPLLAELAAGAVLVTSPAHLSRLAGIAPIEAARRPALVLSAGAPLPLAASNDAAAILGCRPTEIFGSTETGAMATRRERRSEADPWRLLPGVAVRADGEGRMAVRTAVLGPDWLETADLIEPAPGGFVHRGRADRIVKVEGKRVSLAAVEKELLRHPYVAEAAVVTLAGPLRIAAAVVTTETGNKALADMGKFRVGRRLRRAVAEAIDPAAAPRLWRFVTALPVRPMGKRRAGDIAALFGEAK